MMEKIWHKFYDQQVPRSISYPDKTVYQLFQDSVDKNPQGIATLFFGAKIRYRELGNRVDCFANALASMGVEKATGWPWFSLTSPPIRSLILPFSSWVGSWYPPTRFTWRGNSSIS